MNKFNYTESIEICEKALNLIDIKNFLLHGKDLNEIIQDIENYYEDPLSDCPWEVEYFIKEYPEIFGNPPELFNYMTDDEFLEYCKKRYPEVRWGYEYIERYWVSN